MGILNDRAKAIKNREKEEKTPGFLNQRAQDFTSARNERLREEEEERKKREREQKTGGVLSSPLSEESRSASAYDLALKMLQDDEDYFNSLEGRAGIGANEHSWKSTMQSIYANKMLKDSKGTIDSKLGAGATDALRSAVNGTAIGAQRNANAVNQRSRLIESYGGADKYYEAMEYIKTPKGKTEAEVYGGTPESRQLKYIELLDERSALDRELNEEDNDRKLYDPTYEGYLSNDELVEKENEEFIDSDGNKTGQTKRERLDWLNSLITKYERFYLPADKYDHVKQEADWDELSSKGSPVSRYKYLRSKGEDAYFDWETGTYKASSPGLSQKDINTLVGGKSNHYDDLNDEEVKTYNYLYNKMGAKVADQYLDGILVVSGQRAAEEFQKSVKDASVLEQIALSAASLGTNLIGSFSSAVANIGAAATGKYNPYGPGYEMTNITSGIRGGVVDAMPKEKALGLSWGDVYQGVMSGLDSAIQVMTTGGVSSANIGNKAVRSAASYLSTALMGVNAAGQTAKEMWEKGADKGQILGTSMAAGVAEFLFEHWSLESVFSKFVDANPTSRLQVVKNLLIQMGIEGSEEVATDFANLLADGLAMRSQGEWYQLAQKYSGGTNPTATDFAKAFVRDVVPGKLWQSFMGGALGTIFHVAGAGVSQSADVFNTGRQILSEGSAQTLRGVAQEVAQTQGLDPKYARDIERTSERVAKNASPSNVGYMYNAVENAINEGFGDNAEAAVKAGMKVLKSLEKSTDIRTAETSDGQTVTINEDNPIARFEDGKAILNTSNGEMSVDDLSFADDSARLAYDNVNTYDVETANAVLNNYQSGDIARYLAGMREGIELHGKMNVPSEAVSYYSTLSEENQRYARTLGQTMRKSIVNKAVQAAKTGTIERFGATSDMRKVYEGKKKGAFGTKGAVYLLNDIGEDVAHFGENYDYLEAVADTTGAPVVFYDSNTVKNEQLKNANGKYVWKNGAIYVDLNAGPVNGKKGLVAFALSHELTHFAEQWSPEDYKTYADWLVSTYSSKGGSMESLVKARMASEGTDYEEAYHDVIADFSERMLLDSDVLEKLEALREKDKTVWQKIVDKIRTLVNRIIGAYGDENQTYESNAIQDLLNSEELQKMKELWSTAVVEGAKNRAAAVQRTETRRANENAAEIPTVTQFSMKSPVEQTKDLIAWHNISSSSIDGAIELGGFAMPSFAIMPSDRAHTTYGDISVIARKSSIDPQKNGSQKVFAGDAWTPVFPEVKYKLNENAVDNLAGKIYGLLNKTGVKPSELNLVLDKTNMTDKYDRRGGDFVENYRDNYGMKLAFIEDTERHVTIPTKEKQYTSHADIATLKKIAKAVNLDNPDAFGGDEMAYEPTVREIMREYAQKKYGDAAGIGKQKLVDMLYPADEPMSFTDVDRLIYAARQYLNSKETRQTDTAKLEKRIDSLMQSKKVQSEYDEWLKNLGEGLVERKGIRNNKALFTPTGNRRSWDALYGEYSLENIVRAMKGQPQQGRTQFLSGAGSVKGAALEAFSSLEQVRNSQNRLVSEENDDTKNAYDDFSENVKNLANKISDDPFTGSDMLADILSHAKTKDSIERYLRREYDFLRVQDGLDLGKIAAEIYELGQEANTLPMEYFEAKVYRAFPFSEAAAIIVPSNLDKNKVSQIKELGGNVLTYKTGDNEDRLKKANSVEDARFSRKVTPAENARYMELAKDPESNKAELERMVEQAARDAGYEEKWAHGTPNAMFTSFDLSKARGAKAVFLSDRGTASQYAGTSATPIQTRLTGKQISTVKDAVSEIQRINPSYARPKRVDGEYRIGRNTYSDEELIEYANNLREKNSGGVYSLYVKSGNILRVDANGAYWNNIKSEYGKTTDQIGEWARTHGYDGVEIDNVHDGGFNSEYSSDVLLMFDGNDLKSADTVTYDDNGNVIPLTERFNENEGDIRYSYKGRSALTSPTGSLDVRDLRDKQGKENLQIAEKMDREGIDSEKIRLATGWFKGYDGKWRSEIDDSEAKLADWLILGKGKLYMEQQARENAGKARDKVFALQDRLAKSNKTNGANSDESKALRKQIKEARKQTDALNDLSHRVSLNRLNLSDVLDHPKLYENYPQLKDATVHLSYTDERDLNGAWGSTVLGSDEITLATNLDSREDILGTLMHEIQHVIQGIEGFASGANVEYWARRNKAESEAARKAKLRLATVEGKLMNVEYSGNDSASPIKTAMSYAYIVDQLRTDKKGTANYDYDTEAKARYEERAKDGGYSDLLKEYLEAYQDVQIANMEAEDYPRAFADYQRTAGEIEARDVTGRLRMTEEERRANRPDIDRGDVLFYSDKYSRKSSEDYSTRGIVERALKTLPEGAEKKALTEYKQTLDSYDAERMAYNAAVQAGDQDNVARAKNNMKTLSAKLERMENGKSLQNIAAVKDVKALNEDAKDLREMLRAQATETGGTVASKASAKIAADTLAERHNITKGKGELADLISELYTEVMTGVNNGAYSREQVLDMARSVSEWIDEKSSEEWEKANRKEDPEVKDVLNYIKGSRVRINENQKGDIRSRYDGKLIKWMGKLSGYVRVANNATMTLDELWNDLSKEYPHIFDPNTSDADQGVQLADIVSDLKSRRYVTEQDIEPNTEEYEDHIRDISEEVINALWEVKPQLTIADRYAKKIESLREKHNERMRETRRTFEQTIREQREASWQRGKEVAEARQKRRELRTRIKALHKNMSTRLLNPKENKYIPADLRKAVAEVLEAIDTDSGRSEKLTAKLNLMNARYKAIAQEERYHTAYDPYISQMITNLSEAIATAEADNAARGKRAGIYGMTSEHLEMLYTAMKAFDHAVRDDLKKHALGSALDDNLTTHDVGEKLIEETRQTADRSKWMNKLFAGHQLRPSEFFERLAGYKKDSYWMRVYRMLDNAQRRMKMIEMQSNGIFEDILKDKKYLKELVDTKTLVDLQLPGDVKITRGMMLSLYKHLLNEDNARHVAVGGLTVPGIKEYYKQDDEAFKSTKSKVPGFVGNELTEAYKAIEKELEPLEDAWERAAVDNDFEALDEIEKQRQALWSRRDAIIEMGMVIANELRQKIEGMLTDKDREFLAAADEYFDNYSKTVLNEATMAMYGFEKARVEGYFPIHTDSSFRQVKWDQLMGDFTLEGAGFMKDRMKGAVNPILLEDFSTVINQQISKVARYAGLAPALKEFSKLYGIVEGGNEFTTSVQDMIGRKFGAYGTKYIENLIEDLNGSSRREPTFLDKARSFAAGAVLTANIRVSLAQAASYTTAISELGHKAVAKALGKGIKRAPNDIINKYTALLWERKKGYTDVAMGDVRTMNKLFNRVNSKAKWLTGWIQAVDTATVGRLWYACEYWVQDNTDLEKGTDAYYMQVAEKFGDVIEKTQPSYSALQRPDVLRSRSQFTRALTMFMTQRLQNQNIVYGAVRRYHKYRQDYKSGINGVTEEDLKSARNEAVRSVASQIYSAALISGMKLFADVLLRNMGRRRDDEEEVTAQSVLLSSLSDMLSSLASNYLGGSELYDVISALMTGDKWYGISVGGIDALEGTLESFYKNLNGLVKGDGVNFKDLKGLLTDASNLVGLPVSNVYKLLNGVRKTIDDAAHGNFFSFKADGELLDWGKTVERTSKQKGNILLESALNGDDERYAEVYGEFNDSKSKTAGENADAALLEATKDAWIGEEISDEDAKTILKDKLGADEKTIAATLDKWQRKKNGEDIQGFSPYDTLKEAMRDYVDRPEGYNAAGGIEIKKAIQEYRDLGYTDEQIRRAITSEFKDEYVNADTSRRVEMKHFIVTLFVLCGKKESDAKKQVDGWLK